MTRPAPRFLRKLLGEKRAVTVVEFGFVGPVLVLSVMGILDLGYTGYSVSVLQGAVQKAARDSSLETGGNQANAIDDKVKSVFGIIAPDATYTFKRVAYAKFGDVAEPEDYSDNNGDGACNNGEPYEDANRNGQWNADRGSAGSGGARDAVLYTVEASYPRLFPMYGLIGLPQTQKISASTVLRNQPYGEQTVLPPVQRNCA